MVRHVEGTSSSARSGEFLEGEEARAGRSRRAEMAEVPDPASSSPTCSKALLPTTLHIPGRSLPWTFLLPNHPHATTFSILVSIRHPPPLSIPGLIRPHLPTLCLHCRCSTTGPSTLTGDTSGDSLSGRKAMGWKGGEAPRRWLGRETESAIGEGEGGSGGCWEGDRGHASGGSMRDRRC